MPKVSPKLLAHPNFSTPNPDQPQIDPAEAKIDRNSRQNFILRGCSDQTIVDLAKIYNFAVEA